MKVSDSEGLNQQKNKINKRPQLAIDEAFKPGKSGIKIYVERPGHGEKTKEGSLVKVHYEGWLAENFNLFDSSRSKRRPFEFELGKGNLIKGWEIALEGIRQGTKMQIKIPSNLAYGAQGVPSLGIPANADLIFKIEVLKVS